MRCTYSCGSAEHLLHRRTFLGAAAGGVVAGLGAFALPAVARDLESKQRRVLVFNMHGGLSQLESWDPKPGTSTGGPFRAIPTSIPGVHISELLPMTARQMHHLTIAREFIDVETAKAAGRSGFGQMIAFLKADPVCGTMSSFMSTPPWRNATPGSCIAA